MFKLKIIGIYRIVNKITNKSYIGQSINIFQRWSQEIVSVSCPSDKFYNSLLSQAIRQYGIENFECEILEECAEEELNEREQFYIQFYNTLTPNGYNATTGGGVYRNLECCMYDLQGHLQQQFSSNKDIVDFLFAEGSVKDTYRYEIIKMIRQACEGDRQIVWGHRWSYLNDDIKLASDSNKKEVFEINPTTYEIINHWFTCHDAAREIGCETSTLARTCRGEGHTCMNRYFAYQDTLEQLINKLKKQNELIDLDRKIYILKNNEIVATFDQASDAAFYISQGQHKRSASVLRVCNGDRKTAYGYQCCFKENYHIEL